MYKPGTKIIDEQFSQQITDKIVSASSGRGSKVRHSKLSIVQGVKRRHFKPLISCR